MGNKLKIFLFALIAMSFVGLGANYIIQERDNLKLKNIEIKSLTTDVDELNLKYDNLNNKLKDANKDKQLNQKQIDELSEEKKRLEAEKLRLEAELQAKAEAKTKLAQASQKVVNGATGTATASAASGGKEQWLIAAGIPQSDWQFVDCVINGCQGVSPEGGWGGTERWNTTGSGAYGLCQALPASKMASAGADYMTNPVTQLKWCHQYAQGYGGWAAAWNFRKCTGSCYSPRTNTTPYKDHTWW